MPTPAPARPLLSAELAGRTYAAGLTLSGSLAEGERLAGVEFDGCRFTGCVLFGAVLTGCTFTECEFADCDLSRTVVTDSRFSECTFTDSRLLGVNFALAHTGSLAPPFVFERCRLDYASFRGLDITGSVFRECRLRDVDLGETVARRVVFAGSDLAGASFGDTDLREADLAGAVNYALDVRANQVRGARVDVGGAAGLLRPFGIEVVD